jgi:hypothetical protein
MARRPRIFQSRLFQALIEKLIPSMRSAFETAVRELRSGVNWSALLAALKRQDITGAVEALNLDRSAFNSYQQAKTTAFVEGGTLAAQTVNAPKGSTVAIRFDMANPVAEQWIAENAVARAKALADEQMVNARAVVLDGYAQGRHPEVIARDLAGRMVNGQRQGGVIGLSGPQTDLVMSMRQRLESSDAAELKKVLDGMSLRDKRFDHIVRKAAESGEPIARADIERMVQRYSDRMLAKRAEDIARTETGMAVMSGRYEEWRQAAEKFGYPMEAIQKTWRHGLGVKEPRPHHVAMNGKSVRGLDTAFVFSNGARLKYALDPDGGASEVVRCSCGTDFRLDHSWNLT